MALLANFCRREFFKLGKNNVLHRSFSLFGTQRKEKTKSALENYIITHPERDEFNKVYKLMEDHFFHDEPTIRSCDMGYAYNPVFEKEVYETLEYGYSFIAKCKWTDCIVGAVLNFSVSDMYPNLLRTYACSVKDEDTRNLLLFYAYVQEAVDIFVKYCESEAFVIRAVVVEKNNRNLKLATELIKHARKLGKDLAFPIVRCDCSSVALSKICESLGMQWENEIKFCEYLSPAHKPVFDPAPPNLSVSTYIDLPLRLKKYR